MNIGNISPEVIRQLREKYATGISAPKKVKKAKKAVGKKKTVGRRQGQPVAAKSPSTGRKGINPLAGINLDDLMLGIGGEGGGGGNYYRGANPVPTPPMASSPSQGPIYTNMLLPTNPDGAFDQDRELPEFFKNKFPADASELDKLRREYELLEGMRFIRDPGPEHFARIKSLAEQIYAQDQTFESPFLPKKMPQPGTGFGDGPTSGSMPRTGQPGGPQSGTGVGDGPTSGSIQLQVMTKGLDGKMYPNPGAAGEANKRFMAQQEQPAPPKAPAPPINIMGPSYDPNERKEYEEKIRSQMSLMPGQNIISQNPVTMNPLSAVPQTQFGGYGAQMPMKALNPYAGMGAANKKVDFFPDYVDAPPKTT